jgi:predicted transcriptional regulator
LETEKAAMGNYKEHPKYNVLSIRVSDEEKAQLDEMAHRTRKNISVLMREAMQLYSSHFEVATN